MQYVLAYFTAIPIDELTLLASLIFQTDASYGQFRYEFSIEKWDATYRGFPSQYED